MPTKPIDASIVADEIVAAGSSIELTFPTPVDPQSAQGAIRVLRGCEPVKSRIALEKRGRVVTVSLDDGAIGSYEIVISELLGAKGEQLVDYHRLPFAVVPIAGKIPGDLRVEHSVRLVVDQLNVTRVAPGEGARAGYVDVVKAVHRTKGTPVEMAFDDRGERVDFDKQLAELAQRRSGQIRLDSRDSLSQDRARQGRRPRANRRLATARTSSRALRKARRSPIGRAARG